MQNEGKSWTVPTSYDNGLKYLSTYMYFKLTFFKLLRDETLPAEYGKKDQKLNMNQFRNLFGTTRIPGLGKKTKLQQRHTGTSMIFYIQARTI